MNNVVIIGGGPAGLMAADILSRHGVAAALYDAMPTVGRKFLMAGRGGLNLTHAEPWEPFLSRYGARRPQIEPLLQALGPMTSAAGRTNLASKPLLAPRSAFSPPT